MTSELKTEEIGRYLGRRREALALIAVARRLLDTHAVMAATAIEVGGAIEEIERVNALVANVVAFLGGTDNVTAWRAAERTRATSARELFEARVERHAVFAIAGHECGEPDEAWCAGASGHGLPAFRRRVAIERRRLERAAQSTIREERSRR